MNPSCIHNDSTRKNRAASSSEHSDEFSTGSSSGHFSIKGKLRSSTSSNSLSESSINGAIRVFSSPLTAIKSKVSKPKKSSPMIKKRFPLPTLPTMRRSSSELELDNAEHLSGLMSLNGGQKPICEIDKSFESDFDESARWLRQL